MDTRYFIVKVEIETDYTEDELLQAIQKLLAIPGYEYEDCETFNGHVVTIEQ